MLACLWFRPAYLQLSTLKDDFPSVPIAAFTATATQDVQNSISKTLQLQSPVHLQGSFNRSNIEYQVRCKEIIDDGTPDAILKVVPSVSRRLSPKSSADAMTPVS